MLLRVGAGLTAFGLFVTLFSYPDTTFGLVVTAGGVACLLASVVTYLQSGRRRR